MKPQLFRGFGSEHYLLSNFDTPDTGEQRFERVAGQKDQPLGMDCVLEDHRMTVISVKSGTFAERAGIRVGDEIVSLGKHSAVVDLTPTERSQVLEERPLSVGLLRRKVGHIETEVPLYFLLKNLMIFRKDL